jgi:hypothetical protein
MSPEDADRIRQMRGAGDVASQAHMGVQEAGVDPNTMNSLGMLYDYYNQMGGHGGDMFGRGSQALDFGMRTGTGDIDRYLSPYIQGQLNPMRQMFGDMRADEYSGAGQEATGAGAYGGSRHAMLAAKRLGNVDKMQSQYEGDVWNRGYTQAGNWMFGERGRQGQMGLGMMDRYAQAMNAQKGAAGGIAGMGDYLRNIQQMMNERGAKNATNALQMQSGSYGKDIEHGSTKETEKGWAEGLLPLAMDIGKMFIPGGQAAGAAGLFGQMFGGNSDAASSFGQQYQDPWQGLNLSPGNNYGFSGGNPANPALFNPVPAGGYFSDIGYGGS